MGEGFEVEADGEAFLRSGEVDERGTERAFHDRVRVMERRGEASHAVEELLVLMEGDEGGAVAPEEVDIASDAGRRVLGDEIEFKAHGGEIIGR